MVVHKTQGIKVKLFQNFENDKKIQIKCNKNQNDHNKRNMSELPMYAMPNPKNHPQILNEAMALV